MSAVSSHSTHGAFAFRDTNRIPYRITAVQEALVEGFPDQKYEAITAMPEFSNNCFEELRLAHYFYDSTGTSRRYWERPRSLPVPRPTPSQSTSMFTGGFPTINATEAAPPGQAFAALGLSSQPSPPTKTLGDGSGQYTKDNILSFPRSPAAKRIPAVGTAETEWEAARRVVAQKMELLERVQAECDEAVRLERQKFKAYSEARTNFDK